jgi:hypothetical protein
MASGLAANIGAAINSTRTFTGKTDAEYGNIVRLAVMDKVAPPPDGLTTAQLGKYYLDALLSELARYTMQEAAKNLARERAAQKQAIDDQVALDVAL